MRAALIKAFGEPSQVLERPRCRSFGIRLEEVLIGIEYEIALVVKIE